MTSRAQADNDFTFPRRCRCLHGGFAPRASRRCSPVERRSQRTIRLLRHPVASSVSKLRRSTCSPAHRRRGGNWMVGSPKVPTGCLVADLRSRAGRAAPARGLPCPILKSYERLLLFGQRDATLGQAAAGLPTSIASSGGPARLCGRRSSGGRCVSASQPLGLTRRSPHNDWKGRPAAAKGPRLNYSIFSSKTHPGHSGGRHHRGHVTPAVPSVSTPCCAKPLQRCGMDEAQPTYRCVSFCRRESAAAAIDPALSSL